MVLPAKHKKLQRSHIAIIHDRGGIRSQLLSARAEALTQGRDPASLRSGFLIPPPLPLHKRKNPYQGIFSFCGAEEEGFEPSVQFLVRLLSKQVP